MRVRIAPLALCVAALGAFEAVWLLVDVADGTKAEAQGRRAPRRRRPTKVVPITDEPVPENPFGEADAGPPAAAPATTTAAPGQPQPMPGGAAATSTAPGTVVEPPPPPIEETPREDLTAIEDEYHSLVDEIFQARTRVSALGAQLYSTKVRVRVQDRTSREQALQKIQLTMDGDPIFAAEAGFRAEDGRQVFDGFAAPGLHTFGVVAEYRARANDRYVYRLTDSYTFEVVKGRLTEVRVTLEEDSNIAEDFGDDREGEYDVRSRIRVEAIE